MVYRGRVAVVGRTHQGENFVGYQLGARKYPQRQIIESTAEQRLSVRPKSGEEPVLMGIRYLTYDCIGQANGWAVAGNGNHVSTVLAIIGYGTSTYQAITQSLLSWGSEKDEEKTPRIVVAAPLDGRTAWIGKVTDQSGFVACPLNLRRGQCVFISTQQDRKQYTVPVPVGKSTALAKKLLVSGNFGAHSNVIASAAAISDGERFHFQTAHPTDSS